MDDGEHLEPTKDNIIAAYKQVVADSEATDAIFLHYSGKLLSIFIVSVVFPFWNFFSRLLVCFVFFLYRTTGHGTKLKDDDDGEEADGYDEALVPVDYNSGAGMIRDDDLYDILVKPLASGVHMVSLVRSKQNE
jgi:hypothetical protein